MTQMIGHRARLALAALALVLLAGCDNPFRPTLAEYFAGCTAYSRSVQAAECEKIDAWKGSQ